MAVIEEGHIPRRNRAGSNPPYTWLRGWEQVENHMGEEGYLDGEPYTIKDYGPLPDGFSVGAPEPELCAARIAEIRIELQSLDAAKVRPLSAIAEGAATDKVIPIRSPITMYA